MKYQQLLCSSPAQMISEICWLEFKKSEERENKYKNVEARETTMTKEKEKMK
jgi:hypothetical protein